MFKKVSIIALSVLFLLSSNSAFAYDASYVLGQTLFTTSATGTTSTTLSTPKDVEYDSDSETLYVLDYTNNRVLVYDLSDGITNGEAAVHVLGQEDFTTGTSQIAADKFAGPIGLALDSERNLLFVNQEIDSISIFDVNAITDGEDLVNFLGTGSPSPNQNGITSNTFGGMDYDETRELLYVADYGNNRALVFDTAIITDSENAVNVLGQTDFGAGFVASGVAPDGTNSPFQVSFIESFDYLALSDGLSCLRFFDISTITNGESHVKVLGDDNALDCDNNTGAPITGRNSFTLGFLFGGVDANEGKDILYVADPFHGVLLFDIADITDGEDAVSIIGQTSYDFLDIQNGTTASLMAYPSSVAVDEENNRIFVVDDTNHRVLVFEFMNITSTGALAGGTVGSAYSQAVLTEKSQGTVEYAVTSGSLPPGLSFSGDDIVGTPTTAGDYAFTVRGTDVVIDDVQEFSDTAALSISIAAAPSSGGGGGGGGGSSGSKIRGCMDMFALNFNSRAVIDNGSCRYAEVPQAPTTPTISCPVFTGYAKIWDRNNDKNEVVKIQNFLNDKMGESLKADGTFGLGTYFAVKRFQEKYYSEIIVPWAPVNGLDHSTGWWHKTTSAWANELLGCPVNVNL